MIPQQKVMTMYESACAKLWLPTRTHLRLVLVFVFFASILSLWELWSHLVSIKQSVASTTSPHYNGASSDAASHNAAKPHATGDASDMSEFWDKLITILYQTEPEGDEIRPPSSLDREKFDPHSGSPSLGVETIQISKSQLDSLTEKHQDFVEQARQLAPSMPFAKGSRGIVMTSKASSFGIAITSVLMLRRIGSKLPIQLFLDSASDHQRDLCNKSLKKWQVTCLNIDDYLKAPEGAEWETPKLEKYQFKVFALLFSSFQEVLFLDADAFPIRKPDYLFNVEPYKSRGLVTWPDFWLPTISPLFYQIAGADRPEVTMDSRASESGMMLYNKAKHADSLLLAAYYNFYGPKYYYQLQSQGAWGSGDKETFAQSALVLGNPFWQVKTFAEYISSEGVHYGSGIWQADPEQDWKSNSQPEDQMNGTTKATRGKREIKVTKTLFAHLNRVKIDTRRLNVDMDNLISDGETGEFTRIWGDDSDPIIEMAGYDLEKAIWEEIIKANCKTSLLEECETIQDFYNTVFTR